MSKEIQCYIVISITGTWYDLWIFQSLVPLLSRYATDTLQDEPPEDVDWERSLNDLVKLRKICGREYGVSSYNDNSML